MKLYSGPLSLFTAKVRIALAEKGLTYERIEVPFSRADRYHPKHPDVVALHPKAQVPVLIDGDMTLYDSTVIFEYLEERYPETPLYPHTLAERARCRLLEHHADDVFFPQVWALIEEIFYTPDAVQQDCARVAEATVAIQQTFARLDTQLVNLAYLAGEMYTVADIATFIVASYAANLGVFPNPAYTNVQKWFQYITARPAVAAEIVQMSEAAQAL